MEEDHLHSNISGINLYLYVRRRLIFSFKFFLGRNTPFSVTKDLQKSFNAIFGLFVSRWGRERKAMCSREIGPDDGWVGQCSVA